MQYILWVGIPKFREAEPHFVGLHIYMRRVVSVINWQEYREAIKA